MGQSSRSREGHLLVNLFEVLDEHPDGMKAKDALDALARRVEMTEYEQGAYASGGGRRFEKIVRFATVDTVKAGWLLKNKGQWILTDDGRAALTRFRRDTDAFYREARRLYKEWKATRPIDEDDEDEPASGFGTSERTATLTYEEADEAAWSEIEAYLGQMNPYDLQELVASLLRAMGYHVSWVAPQGRDGGLDIIGFTDPLGTRGPRIKVQVKREATAVDADGLRSFLALIGEEDVGIFVNVGGFTKPAQQEARTQERRRVTLINAEQLLDLWVEHYDKLDVNARARLPLKPIYFLAPTE